MGYTNNNYWGQLMSSMSSSPFGSQMANSNQYIHQQYGQSVAINPYWQGIPIVKAIKTIRQELQDEVSKWLTF